VSAAADAVGAACLLGPRCSESYSRLDIEGWSSMNVSIGLMEALRRLWLVGGGGGNTSVATAAAFWGWGV